MDSLVIADQRRRDLYLVVVKLGDVAALIGDHQAVHPPSTIRTCPVT